MDRVKIDCILREAELKVWGRTIQSLCLLGGTDVHFGFTEEAVCLTTYEPSITTYASLTFKDSFFSSYECGAEESDNLECKVPTKCLLKPFRSMKFLTKCASECSIRYTKDADTMDVTLTTNYGAKICYSLRLLSDSDLIELDYDFSSLKSILTCDAKVFLGSLSNFHSTKDAGDLTLKFNSTQMSLRNAVTDLVRKEGKVYTELILDGAEFINYTIAGDCQLTFPLRDFKTFVIFADSMRLPISLRFQDDTKPVVVIIATPEGNFEGRLTLANRGSVAASQLDNMEVMSSSVEPVDFQANRSESRLTLSGFQISELCVQPNATPPPRVISPLTAPVKRKASLLFPNPARRPRIEEPELISVGETLTVVDVEENSHVVMQLD